MGENINAIEIKKEELRLELLRKNPNREKIKRLQDSIKRHKNIDENIRKFSFKDRKNKGYYSRYK